MKKYFKSVLFSAVSALILFTGCNKEVPLPDDAEITAAEITSETVSVPDSPVIETQTTEPEAVTEPKSYEPYRIKLYDSLGTGIPRPDDYGKDLTTYYLGGELDDILNFMKDEEAAGKIRQETNALDDLAVQSYYLYSEDDKPIFDENMSTYCGAYNGYLFYNVFYRDFPMAYCAVFDLRTGDRLELSDMFFDGEDFLGLLNKKISEEIQKLILEFYEYEEFKYIPMKREFAGLTEDGFYFNSYTIYFPVDNPYFAECTKIDVRISDFDTVLNVPYDMTGLFKDEAADELHFRKSTENLASSIGIHTKHIQTGNINIYLFDGALQLTPEQEEFVNTQALGMTGEILDKMRRENNWTAYTDGETPLYRTYEYDGVEYEYTDTYDICIEIIKNNIVKIRFYQSDYYDDHVPSYYIYFDLETFAPLDADQLFERIFADNNYVWDYTYVHKSDSWDSINDLEGFRKDDIPDISRLKTENIGVYDDNIHYDGQIDDYYISGYIYSE